MRSNAVPQKNPLNHTYSCRPHQSINHSINRSYNTGISRSLPISSIETRPSPNVGFPFPVLSFPVIAYNIYLAFHYTDVWITTLTQSRTCLLELVILASRTWRNHEHIRYVLP
uniref:Uncharacterized protein n=1 Tax=Hyaloperonospora arabidopsidis (strain Emoy2) TaxID=559515 RepID=M4C228_HYAAE